MERTSLKRKKQELRRNLKIYIQSTEIHDDNQTENVNQGTDNASDSLSQGQNGRDARDSEGHSPIKDNPSTTSKHHSKKKKNSKKPVSYTHLTLPTICSV